MKKALSMLLALLMIAPLVVSCSETTTQEETTPNAEVAGETTGETVEETEDPWLGLPKTDMGGLTFTFLTSNWGGEAIRFVDDIIAEEYTGAPINDAVYSRNISVEANPLDIKFNIGKSPIS